LNNTWLEEQTKQLFNHNEIKEIEAPKEIFDQLIQEHGQHKEFYYTGMNGITILIKERKENNGTV